MSQASFANGICDDLLLGSSLWPNPKTQDTSTGGTFQISELAEKERAGREWSQEALNSLAPKKQCSRWDTTLANVADTPKHSCWDQMPRMLFLPLPLPALLLNYPQKFLELVTLHSSSLRICTTLPRFSKRRTRQSLSVEEVKECKIMYLLLKIKLSRMAHCLSVRLCCARARTKPATLELGCSSIKFYLCSWSGPLRTRSVIDLSRSLTESCIGLTTLYVFTYTRSSLSPSHS